MGFIADNFGNYAAYKEWEINDDREYMVKLINNDASTETILKHNPEGITSFGESAERDRVYHGILPTYSLQLEFKADDLSGGSFLQTAYEAKGIETDLSAKIYKKNPDTFDFDLLYDYKGDFNEGQYEDNLDSVSLFLVQSGLLQKFTSRDELEIDMLSNTSIDGDTVTDVSSNTTTFFGVDIYLDSNGINGNITEFATYLSSQTVNAYYFGGVEIRNRIGDNLDYTPIDGVIYTNELDDAVQLKIDISMPYEIDTTTGIGSTITVEYRFDIYNSDDSLYDENIIETVSRNNAGSQTDTGVVSINFDYTDITVPSNGYAVFYAKITVFKGFGDAIISMNFLGTRTLSFVEKSPSIGDTTATTYRVNDVLKKLTRLITSDNNAYTSTYIPSNPVFNTLMLNSWMLRKFPDKKFVLKFLDVFKSIAYAEGLGLGYDRVNNQIFVEELEQFYQDIQVVDFGVVKDFKQRPSRYYNSIKSGCSSDGEYEEDDGVYEFNVKTNYRTHFEVPNDLDLEIPFRIDTLSFEYDRRVQYNIRGIEDTRYDGLNYMVFGSGASQVAVNTNNMQGFEGIDEYYNGRYLARENIKRMAGVLGGMFWKSTGKSINFVNNIKDQNITYVEGTTRINLSDDISQTLLGSGFFNYQEQEFTASLTTDKLNAIRTNPHGYYKCTDDVNGDTHYGYFQRWKVLDFEKEIEVTGLEANIDR